MLENLKAQLASSGRRETARLTILAALAIAIAGAFVGSRGCGAAKESTESAAVPPAAPDGTDPAVQVDREKVLAPGDGPAAHQDASYEKGALDYVLSMTRKTLAEAPRHVTAEEFVALPFAEAAGHLFQVKGKVTDVVTQEFRGETERLWSLVVEGGAGARFVVLKHGLSSDPNQGQPRSSALLAPDWIQEGDQIAVRGIYLQRRVGTVGKTALAEPTPVLVALKFRKVLETRPVIASPAEASWETVEDRFMAETKLLVEPAMLQTIQWAEARGYAKIHEDIVSGKLPWKDWDRQTFGVWGKEIQVTRKDQERPFTDGARGKLWRVEVVVGQVAEEGWDSPDLSANPWGVDHVYLLDLLPEDYTYLGRSLPLRTFSPFPLDTYPGVTGKKLQTIRFYGFFVKNITIATKYKSESGDGPAEVTVPTFVVVDGEPVLHEGADQTALWWVAASMVLLGVIFYLVLMRGEKKEAAQMERYRIGLRQRMRAKGQGHAAAPYVPPEGPPKADGPPRGPGGG